MKKLAFILLLCPFFRNDLVAQEKEIDTTNYIPMKEIIVIGDKGAVSQKTVKSLATVDEYLDRSSKISMIKRGAYAWEPMINGMATERTVITIDGMRIFSACTDKMDPVTSYVEISNLSEASISSGQEGAEYGATIGGAVNMELHKTGFTESGWNIGLSSGLESNGEQKIAGAKLDYAEDSFFLNTDFMYRDAENYYAGGNQEVQYSRFTKYNFSAVSGLRLSEHQTLQGSLIFDKATDVGYPALPMDVSSAEAVITSLKYEHHKPLDYIDHWETKIYFNSIEHIMDDSQRPDVPIRMDMPGWSDTYGFYSKINTSLKGHEIKVNLNSFYNKSLAEMTMFPNDPNEKEMFMFTWPDVRTFYTGIFMEDRIRLNDYLHLNLSGSLGSQTNRVESKPGLQSLRIFYPEMAEKNQRVLAAASSKLQLQKKHFSYTLGIGYGERAPSVSEGYGFYLFNSFDGFDYIGKPRLSNERSVELNTSVGFTKKRWSIKASGSYFHINNYILGKPDAALSPMTIGANGVKVYEQLEYASLFNTHLSLDFLIDQHWNFNGKAIYNLGRDHNNENLPLVQPFTYYSALQFQKGFFSAEAAVEGALKQSDFSEEFGENETPAYAVVNLSASQILYLNQQKMTIKVGAENLFDTYYSTFSDWNNIPRRGRNLFVNLNYVVF
ncbi:TonB-dependent receptor plug domain-containing protein [Salinimicrobium sp. TH3]|uniref:TonB-dependent receptor plug domain-containing protein n=1 Tax=Salinimicrobium sp. TH3 TaxID=2997342 RepID=UPI002275A507|nr:TonB-dependent receptor [Salinimicrobium sp. TH3]MCY2688593.1 TonB-dependent receptor [Salinimicrobium sp. TH3]